MKKPLLYPIISLLLALALSLTFLTACASQVRETAAVDEGLVDWVNAQDTLAAAEAAAGIRAIDASRKAVIQSSIEESQSIEASIAESLAAESRKAASIEESEYIRQSIEESESRSVEESIAASIYAVESWEALLESIAESIVSGGTPTGVLEAGKVSTVGDEAIPQLRQLFADVTIIGHSGAKNVLDSGILTDSNIFYKWAAHMDEIDEIVDQAAKRGPGKVLFLMGTNDMGYYCQNVDVWKKDYIAVIDRYLAANPGAEVYLQEIIPIPEAYWYRWYNHFRIDDYNNAMREICEEYGYTQVSATDFAFPAFIADDSGTHYNKQYHFYWAQTMANQLGLWEELS